MCRQTIRDTRRAAHALLSAGVTGKAVWGKDLRWRVAARRIHNVVDPDGPCPVSITGGRVNTWRCTVPARKLADEEINKLLSRLPGWRVMNGKLHRQYECKDFNAAFGNMTRVALIAEAMNHHPEWSNVWNRVSFELVTHSVKGISDLDFVLAEKIEEIFSAQAVSRATSGT